MEVPIVQIKLESSTAHIAADAAPRVKLPDVGKPVTPAPNTWAESEGSATVTSMLTHELQPTNRDKYENKPLPKNTTPISENANLRQRRHIQPAIPLINTSFYPKHRAITDPIQHRSLFSTKKPSISQLKKKGKILDFSTSKVDLSGGSNFPSTDVPPKALQFLGVQQEEASGQQPSYHRDQISIQAQRLHDGAASSDPMSEGPSPSIRQTDLSITVAETPINKQSSPQHPPLLDAQNLGVTETSAVPQDKNTQSLPVPIIAAPVNGGKQFGVVRQRILHPSQSFQAIIETASPTSTQEHGASNLEHHMTPTKCLQREPSGEILRPTVYSPDSYNGIWEFDPAVGHTLPPFSPMPKTGHPDHKHVPEKLMISPNDLLRDTYREKFPRNPSAMYGGQPQNPQEGPMRVVNRTASRGLPNEAGQLDPAQFSNSLTKTGSQPQICSTAPSRTVPTGQDTGFRSQNPVPHNQHGQQKPILGFRTESVFNTLPTPANNSWATTTPSKSPAPPPLHWSALQLYNSVPSPPVSQQDYVRPSPLSAGLAQLDMTLHHHIDSVFNSLSRQITDKHDRVLDQVLLRIDNLEDKLCRDVKGIKLEMSSCKKEIDKVRTATTQTSYAHDTMIEMLQALIGKLAALEGHVDQIKCKGHIQFVNPSTSETRGTHERHQSTQNRGRSAHGSLDGSLSSGDRQCCSQHRNVVGAVTSSRSPSKTRHSGNGVNSELKGTRSRAVSISSWQTGEGRMEADRAMGIEKMAGPDLRSHPAYQRQMEVRQMNNSLKLGEETFSKETLGEKGWYQQAYGKRD